MSMPAPSLRARSARLESQPCGHRQCPVGARPVIQPTLKSMRVNAAVPPTDAANPSWGPTIAGLCAVRLERLHLARSVCWCERDCCWMEVRSCACRMATAISMQMRVVRHQRDELRAHLRTGETRLLLSSYGSRTCDWLGSTCHPLPATVLATRRRACSLFRRCFGKCSF